MRRLILMIWLLLPWLSTGCVTHKLWSESTLDEWNEPAVNPNLRLFHDREKDDFLVVYNEYSDRHYTIKARAFFLYQNLKPLTTHGRPYFVSPNTACSLTPVNVFFLMPTNRPDQFFGITTNNGGNFAIYHGCRELGSYSLPFYNDGIGRMERIAWTPLTVVADLTIIGGVVVIICWEGLAQSNYSAGVH